MKKQASKNDLDLHEIVKEAISGALLDGQNQIHDLRDRKATAKAIEKRMGASLRFHFTKFLERFESTDMISRSAFKRLLTQKDEAIEKLKEENSFHVEKRSFQFKRIEELEAQIKTYAKRFGGQAHGNNLLKEKNKALKKEISALEFALKTEEGSHRASIRNLERSIEEMAKEKELADTEIRSYGILEEKIKSASLWQRLKFVFTGINV